MENEHNNTHLIMMKELSEIKSSLAVNTNETTNIKSRVAEIQEMVKDTKTAVQIQNGRVRTLEDWSSDAKKILESNSKIVSLYSVDKGRVYTAIAIFTLLGGTIIALSILSIKSTIKEGINTAFNERFERVELITNK